VRRTRALSPPGPTACSRTVFLHHQSPTTCTLGLVAQARLRALDSSSCSTELTLVVTEPRRVKQGRLCRRHRRGMGIHRDSKVPSAGHSANEFGFMQTAVSRERPVDYAVLGSRLGGEAARGKILWVGGASAGATPARRMVWFVSERVCPGVPGRKRRAVHTRGGDLWHDARHVQLGRRGGGGHALHMPPSTRSAAWRHQRRREAGIVTAGSCTRW